MPTRTILVADDEPEQVATLQALLSERGYRVFTAINGEEVLRKAVEFHPNLIILDIMMPGMDGTEVAMLLRRDPRTHDIPVFFVTAVISEDDQVDSEGHPNLIFAKPLKLDLLLQAVRDKMADEPF